MSNFEFFIYTIIIVIIILFIIWLFFGDGDYEYKGLDFFSPPKANSQSDDYCEINSDCESSESSKSERVERIERVEEIEELNVPEIFKEENKKNVEECEVESQSKISTVIKFLPTYDIEYYRNFKFNDQKGINKGGMEKKTALESRGESLCRSILEKFFQKPFPSVRPDFLLNPVTGKNLELDCFNAELGLALEYNGSQHYDFPNTFHKTFEEYEAQKRRDDLKIRVCEAAGVYLITVPYRIPHHKLPKYIEYYLPENVQHRRENGIDEETEDSFWDDNTTSFPKNGFL